MASIPTQTLRDYKTEVLQSIRNHNIDRLIEIFSGLSKEDGRALANTRDKDNWPVLFVAIRDNYKPGYELLLKNGADPLMYFGNTNQALHIAAMYGNAEAAKYLIQECKIKPMPNTRSEMPSHIAQRNRHEDLSRFLQSIEPQNKPQEKEQWKQARGHSIHGGMRRHLRQDRSGS